MTEDDVRAMEAIISKTSVNAEVEARWTNDQLNALREQEQYLVLSWNFSREMRDEIKMAAVIRDLEKTREGITFLMNRMNELIQRLRSISRSPDLVSGNPS